MIWTDRPPLREPTMVVALRGWNDAGDAASNALAWLHHRWGARRVAQVDSERYFDYQATRPEVAVVDGATRSLVWPGVELAAAALPDGPRDAVLVSGVEPNLAWRSLCTELIGAAQALGSKTVVTLGALLGDVPHTRPVPLIGTAPAPDLVRRLGLRPSEYEGPTGILGVLQHECRAAGLPSVSVWASVPHYLAAPPNPKATLALLSLVPDLVGTDVDHHELDVVTAVWQSSIDRAVEADPELSAHVKTLERRLDAADLASETGERLAADIEAFLEGREEHPPG